MHETFTGHPARIGHTMMDADKTQRTAFEIEVLRMLEMNHQPKLFFFSRDDKCSKHITNFTEANKQHVYKRVYRFHYARTEADTQTQTNEAHQAWEIDEQYRSFRTYFDGQ